MSKLWLQLWRCRTGDSQSRGWPSPGQATRRAEQNSFLLRDGIFHLSLSSRKPRLAFLQIFLNSTVITSSLVFTMNFLKSLFIKTDLERTNSLGLIDLPPPPSVRRKSSVKEKINSTRTKFARIKGRYIR